MHTNKAGWADIDITPPLGLPLGGRGPRFTNGATILDPLTIHALALEDATGARTLWLSFDLIGVSFATSAQWRYDLAAATGVPYAAIILNFAHTHSAPMVNFDKYPAVIAEPPALRTYRATLHRKLLDVACAALRTLRPATVTLHSGRSDVGINRRNRNAAGDVVMAPNPDGVYNPDLWMLDVYATTDGSRTSRPPSPADRCIIFNYGCHPVIAYGFAWDGISADYPGVCRRQLKARFGPGVHCQFIQGLAGNVRPRVLAGADAFRKSTPADLQQAGAQLADDVARVLDAPGVPLDLDLAAVGGWIPGTRDLTRAPSLDHWQAMAARDDELSHNVGQYWLNRMQSGPPLAVAEPLELGLLRLTRDHLIAWFSAEAVAEWLASLRAWLANDHLIAWGYCQHVPTYLPTDALIDEGGYEVINANWYSTNGPAPFARGIDNAVRQRFTTLRQQIEQIKQIP